MRAIPPALRLAAALALATPIVACTVVGGRQDVVAYVDDSVNSIRAKYVEDPGVHFGDVGVTTMNGNVRLSGKVNSVAEARRAAQIARTVPGVRAVDSNITVRQM